jgi:hypothetical protein
MSLCQCQKQANQRTKELEKTGKRTQYFDLAYFYQERPDLCSVDITQG